MNEKTLINKAIRQTEKMMETLQPNRENCLVCKYWNKDKIFLSDDYCIRPSNSSPCPLSAECKEYIGIVVDCIERLEKHLVKLWGKYHE